MSLRSIRQAMAKQLVPIELQHFEVVEVDGEVGTLRCPIPDCETEFTVNRFDFKSMPGTPIRFCPCCMRASVVPGRKIPPGIGVDMIPMPR